MDEINDALFVYLGGKPHAMIGGVWGRWVDVRMKVDNAVGAAESQWEGWIAATGWSVQGEGCGSRVLDSCWLVKIATIKIDDCGLADATGYGFCINACFHDGR